MPGAYVCDNDCCTISGIECQLTTNLRINILVEQINQIIS